MNPNTAFLALGSNLPQREDNLLNACRLLRESGWILRRISPVYESPPYQGMQQPNYLNLVLECQNHLDARAALKSIQSVERQLGRKRSEKWASRLIDIDILYFNQTVLDTEELRIPHYDLHQRGFFLLPLNDIAPQWQDPFQHKTVQTLLREWEQTTDEAIPWQCSSLEVDRWLTQD